MASLHPELRTPTDSPPQRRPLKQRALLRRRGVGDACGVGAALLRQRLAGKAVSAEHHRPSTPPISWGFREFHATSTDVLALADVMESYRDSFRALSTTSRYPELSGLPCCGTWPARLPFTSSPTSRPTRTRGPLSWAASSSPSLKPTTPSWARRTTTPRSPSAGSRTWTSTPCTGRNDLPIPNGCETVALEKRTPKKTMCECTAGRCLILLLHQPNTEASGEKIAKMMGNLVDPATGRKRSKAELAHETCLLGQSDSEEVDYNFSPSKFVLGAKVWRLHRAFQPLLHELRQVQEHERLRGPGQVRAARGKSTLRPCEWF